MKKRNEKKALRKGIVRRLLGYVRPYKGYVVGAALFSVLYVGFTLVGPVLYGFAIDNMVGAGQVEEPVAVEKHDGDGVQTGEPPDGKRRTPTCCSPRFCPARRFRGPIIHDGSFGAETVKADGLIDPSFRGRRVADCLRPFDELCVFPLAESKSGSVTTEVIA